MEDSKKLGLGACSALLIGGMIGSAIFSLSGLTMFQAGPASVITWMVAAVIMLIYGLLMGELSGVYPKSGGVYVFPRRAFGGRKGQIWGWISCWGYILGNISAVAFAAIYVGTYLSVAFPWAKNLQIPLAIISIVVCMFLNIIKFSTAGKINNILVALLVVTMLIYICVAFFGGNYNSGLLVPFFTQGVSGGFGFLSAVPTAMVGYGGVVAIAFMVSEVKDPNRTVPKSMLISMTVVVILYILIILSTLGLITAGYLTKNPGMQFIPLFAACFVKLTSVPWLTAVVSISAVLALMTTMLVCISLNARAIQAASEDDILPAKLGENNNADVPGVAAIVTSVISAVVACFPQFTSQIVNFGAIFSVVTIVINIIALMAARKKEKYPQDSFRAPGGSVLPVVALVLLVICNISGVFTGGWVIWMYTIAFILIGLLIYQYSSAGKSTVD
jgi:APA family basic amino acid/polyamine antiporter